MAKMIPVECDIKKRPYSEITVFEEIKKQFDDQWLIFHSFDYVSRDMHKLRWDGEIDFLFHHPDLGILILEVKGGQISYRDGIWYQNGHKTSPLEQAKKNKYAIMKLLSNKLNVNYNAVPVKLAHAVCFPDCGMHNVWPAEAQGLVVTGNELPYLKDFVLNVLKETKSIKTSGHQNLTESIRQILMPYFDYGYRLFERVDNEERILLTCTELQCSLLAALENFKTLQVRGCAGSGKTVMAVKRAIQLASQGKEVLLLCYNQLLATYMKKAVADYSNITVSAFHDFCLDKLQISQAEIELKQQKQNFYQNELPERLYQYLYDVGYRVDAVIVDEGQDFSPASWKAMQSMVKSDGHFYIFYDPDQNLFQKKLELPHCATPAVVLNRNCRNTRNIFDAIKPLASDAGILPMDGIPIGLPVRHYYIENQDSRRELLSNIIKQLIDEEKVTLPEIVIIGGHSMENTCIGSNSMVGNFRIVTNKDTSFNNQILYYSYMKYKGCESRVAILLDVAGSDPRWQEKSACYTAMSRARHLLIIIHAESLEKANL